MNVSKLNALFDAGKRRSYIVGSPACGVAVGLDLEGRLFGLLDGRVLNRVNPEAFLGTSTRETYVNPGGDGLWPAPEGSQLGYEYATGAWRVPPGLTGARFWLLETTPTSAAIRAEIDLINARGHGIPVALERHISIEPRPGELAMSVTEVVEYLGRRELGPHEALLAPWTLCQFDCGPGCTALFPDVGPDCVWDLYEDSSAQRGVHDGVWVSRTDGGPRYQVGLSPDIAWLEFRNPEGGLTVKRTADPLPEGLEYIDIADRDPAQPSTGAPVRFSIYSDPSCFMEIEAAGGAAAPLAPGARSSLTVHTLYALEK